MKRLILVDDHKMLRKGISSFFAENSDWTVYAEAENLSEVDEVIKKISQDENISLLNKDEPVVAIVDIQLDGGDGDSFSGFKTIRKLAEVCVPSVVFSSHDTGAFINRAMSADVGAMWFVSKLSDEKTLLDAVNTVAEGKTFVQPDLFASLIEAQTLFSVLTKREISIIGFLHDGLSNEEISEKLNIKPRTLENYLSALYEKAGCSDRKTLLEKLV